MLKIYDEPRDDLFIEETIIKKIMFIKDFIGNILNEIKVYSSLTKYS